MTLPFPRSAPGPELRFAVTGADHDPHAAGPTLRLGLRVAESTGTRVHALALRTQIRIEPAARRYGAGEAEALVELFGEPARWGRTLNPMQLATVSTVTPSFTGEHDATVEVPLTFDTEVGTTRYFRGVAVGAAARESLEGRLRDAESPEGRLRDNAGAGDGGGAGAGDDNGGGAGAGDVVPLRLLFSGTVFYEGPTGVQVGLVPWHSEATFRLPVAVWRDMMAAHHGGLAWLQLPEATLRRLSAWRAARALPSWEQTFAALLEGRDE